MSDLRGFVYGLESLRNMQAWRRDASRVALARAQRVLDVTATRLAELRGQRQQAARMVEARNGRIDPALHGAGLGYLDGLAELIIQCEREIAQLEHARDAARQACLEQQRACDATDHHREDACALYIAEQQAAELRTADSDWLMRAAASISRGDAQ